MSKTRSTESRVGYRFDRASAMYEQKTVFYRFDRASGNWYVRRYVRLWFCASAKFVASLDRAVAREQRVQDHAAREASREREAFLRQVEADAGAAGIAPSPVLPPAAARRPVTRSSLVRVAVEGYLAAGAPVVRPERGAESVKVYTHVRPATREAVDALEVTLPPWRGRGAKTRVVRAAVRWWIGRKK